MAEIQYHKKQEDHSVESIWGDSFSSQKYKYTYSKDEIMELNKNQPIEPPEELVASSLYSPVSLVPVNQDQEQLDDFERALEGTGKWASYNIQRGKTWKGGRGRGGKLSNSENSLSYTSTRGKNDKWDSGRKKFFDTSNSYRNDDLTPPPTPPGNLRASFDSTNQIAPPPGLNSVNWQYKDQKGVIQGPFKSEKMNEWYHANFLPLDLMVKRTNQTDFYPLSHLVNENPAAPFHLSFSSVVLPGKPAGLPQNQLPKKENEISPDFAKLLGIEVNTPVVPVTPTSIPLNVPNSVPNQPFSAFKNSSGGFSTPNFNYANTFTPAIDPTLLYNNLYSPMSVPMNNPYNMMDPQLQLQAQLQLHQMQMQQFQGVPIHPQLFVQSQLSPQNANPLLQQQIPLHSIPQVAQSLPNQQPTLTANNTLDQNLKPNPLKSSSNQIPNQQQVSNTTPVVDQPKAVPQSEVQTPVSKPAAQPTPVTPQPSALSSSSDSNNNNQTTKLSKSAKKKKNKKAKANNSSPASPHTKSNDNLPTISEPSFPSPVKPSATPSPTPPAPSPSLDDSVDETSQWPALSAKQTKKAKAVSSAAGKTSSAPSSKPSATPWSNVVGKPDNSNNNNNNNNVVTPTPSLSTSSSSLPNATTKVNNNKLSTSSGSNNNTAIKEKKSNEPTWAATVLPPKSVQDIQREELEMKKQQKRQEKEKLQKNIENEKKLSAQSSPWATILSDAKPVASKFTEIQESDKVISKAEKEVRKKQTSYQLQVEESKKASPWKVNTVATSSSSKKTLFEIQQEEKRLLEIQQENERNNLLLQQAALGTPTATNTATSWANKLAAPTPSRPKSLREIQEEEMQTRKSVPQKSTSSAPLGWKTAWNNNNNVNNPADNAPSTPPKADEDQSSDQSAADLLWAQGSNNSSANKKPMGAWANKLGGSVAQSTTREEENIINNNKNDDDDDDELFWGAPVPTPSPASSGKNDNKGNSSKGVNNSNNNKSNSSRGRGKRR